jgi:hypothetical protein
MAGRDWLVVAEGGAAQLDAGHRQCTNSPSSAGFMSSSNITPPPFSRPLLPVGVLPGPTPTPVAETTPANQPLRAAGAQQRCSTNPHEPPHLSPPALVQRPATRGLVVAVVAGIPRWHASDGFKSPQLHSPSAPVKRSSAHPLRGLTARRCADPVTALRHLDAGHLAGGLTVYLHSVTDDALTTSGGTQAARVDAHVWLIGRVRSAWWWPGMKLKSNGR